MDFLTFCFKFELSRLPQKPLTYARTIFRVSFLKCRREKVCQFQKPNLIVLHFIGSSVPTSSSGAMANRSSTNVKDRKSQGDQLEADLFESIKAHFHDSGTFRTLKSQLRARVLENVRCESAGQSMNVQSSASRESPSCPIQLTCSLVDEFLDWMGFQYTREMLETESGVAVSRDLFMMKLAERYQNYEVNEKLPTLINIVSNVIGDVTTAEAKASNVFDEREF